MKPVFISTIGLLLLLAGGILAGVIIPLQARSESAVSATTGFNIRDQSETTNLQVLVSKYSNSQGNDSWFNVPLDFTDPTLSHWNRGGWELVAFQIPGTNTRRGWYLDCGAHTANLTFYGFNQDIGLVWL